MLNEPMVKMFAIFDHRKWPSGNNLLTYGIPEVTQLFHHFKHFFDDTSLDIALQQWSALQTEIASAPGLMQRSVKDLWPHMIKMFSDEYCFILRVVVIMLLQSPDNSECERIFSLMNDLKTSERNRLNNRNLRNLMVWHYYGKRFKNISELPVLEILAEFRSICEMKQVRKPHRPQPPMVWPHKVEK